MNSKSRIFSFLIIFTIAMLVGSCKKDSVLNPLGNCDNLATAVSQAANVFIANPTVATCEAYKDALQNYIDGCTGYAYYNAAYQGAIDDLDCTDYEE